MKKIATVLFLAVLLALTCLHLCGCQNKKILKSPQSEPPLTLEETAEEAEIGKEPQDPVEARAAEILSGMTMDQKVGQMFLARCPTGIAEEEMKKYQFGGYILYKRDFKNDDWITEEELANVLDKYRNAALIPPFFAVDEEGGTVLRATVNPKLFPEGKLDSPQNIWKKQGKEALYSEIFDVNKKLKDYGLNINIAPVADVVTNQDAFMYDRSLGSSAEVVAELVGIEVSAVTESGMGSVLKHFPGYGNNADTHDNNEVIDDRPYEQFEKEDFLPFKSGMAAGAGGVMMSHITVSCMDPNLPASLSPEAHRILREELDFDGVVITDDLIMKPILLSGSNGSSAVDAIRAGNDMIVSTRYVEGIEKTMLAVENGLLTEERIDESVLRIIKWKLELGIME